MIFGLRLKSRLRVVYEVSRGCVSVRWVLVLLLGILVICIVFLGFFRLWLFWEKWLEVLFYYDYLW